jgi:hypothetical protein
LGTSSDAIKRTTLVYDQYSTEARQFLRDLA